MAGFLICLPSAAHIAKEGHSRELVLSLPVVNLSNQSKEANQSKGLPVVRVVNFYVFLHSMYGTI
jgi:hypothetical protein